MSNFNIIETMCLSIYKVISRFTDDAWYLSKLSVSLGICLNLIILVDKLGFSGVETQNQWADWAIFTIIIGLLYLVVSQFSDQKKLEEATEKYSSRDYVVVAWLISSMFLFPLL